MTAVALLLGRATLGRLAELWLARRNTAGLLARGAVEIAPGHYPAIVLLHAAWLGALWVFGWNQPVDLVWFAVFAVLQTRRVWVLGTLGSRWTTRILIMPAERLVKRGPYRFVNHPNYVVWWARSQFCHCASGCLGWP